MTYASAKKNLWFTPTKVTDLLAKIVAGTDKNGAVFAIGAAKPINVVGNGGATPTFAYGYNTVTLNANATPVFPTALAGQEVVVALKQDATGSRTVTWPATAKFAGGTAPTLSTAAAKTDVITFRCIDGTNWFASAAAIDVR